MSVEDDIVAGAYFNDEFSPSIRYEHPDHKAVQEAIKGIDFGTPGPQWGRTVPEYPQVAETLEVPPSLYCAVMCVEPEPIDPASNLFAFFARERCSRPMAGAAYGRAELPSGSIFSRVQPFWKNFTVQIELDYPVAPCPPATAGARPSHGADRVSLSPARIATAECSRGSSCIGSSSARSKRARRLSPSPHG